MKIILFEKLFIKAIGTKYWAKCGFGHNYNGYYTGALMDFFWLGFTRDYQDYKILVMNKTIFFFSKGN